MPYAHTTWLQLQNALLERLGDSVFFTNDPTVYSEIQGYLKEALRFWAAASHRWKDRVVFNATANTFWYDLSTQATLPASKLAYAVKDQHLLAEIQYHFIEPVNFSTWTGTDQFNLAEIQAALQRRRDQFILETGCHLIRDILTVSPVPLEGRLEIHTNVGRPVMDIRRLAWRSTAGVYTHLFREDEFGADSFLRNWNITPETTPLGYSVVSTPPLIIQLIPPVNEIGELEIIATFPGAALDTATGILLGVPDNYAWAIKYGAMADLLGKEAQARDPLRAAYCERRWQEGVELARMGSLIMNAQVNGVPVDVEAIHNMDGFALGWQNVTPGVPSTVGIAGLNLIALSPLPDAAHSLTLDCLIPAPIPATNATQLQVGPEELDAILDEAVHIASFKHGGEEFQDTLRHHENMIKLAAVHNERIRACAQFAQVLHDTATDEEALRPRRRKGNEPLKI